MRKFNITVNGKTYQVEVEEVGSAVSYTPAPAAAPKAAPAPVAAPEPAPAPAPAPAAKEVPASAPAPKKEAPATAGSGEVIECPMPGTILSVNVKEGDTVKRGDVLFILEAMKMENEIMAPHDGKIVSVAVSQGASVNTGDTLAVLA